MNSIYSLFREFHILKKFKLLLKDWWNVDLFLLEKGNNGWFYDTKTELHNPVVKALLNSNVFQASFLDSFAQVNPKEKDTFFLSWKQTQMGIFAVPIWLENSLEGFLVITGFKGAEEKRLFEILSYLNLPEKTIQESLEGLQTLQKKDLFYIQRLLTILTEEALELFKEEKEKSKKEVSKYKDFIGESPSIQFLFRVLEKIKAHNKPLIIEGEKGTGKELFAKLLHQCSPSSNQPFLVQDCSALKENLLKEELFGKEEKAGLLEQVKEGTLVLKGIHHLSLDLQNQLCRTLKEGSCFRENKNTPQKIEARIIATSTENLKHLSDKGVFSDDLFYQLNVINIKMPPLRSRLEDIPLLVKHFLNQMSTTGKRKTLSKVVLKCFYNYSWPENIHELKKEVEKLVVLSEETDMTLDETHLSPNLKKTLSHSPALSLFEGKTLKEALKTLEKHMILETLRKENGNKSKVAELLGLSRTSLITKTRDYKTSSESA